MASINPPLEHSAGRRMSMAALQAPRLVMSWEDWLTFAAAVITFVSVAVSLEQANWVDDMPPFVPTAVLGLLIGMFAARVRFHAAAIHPIALALGAAIVVLVAQTYADGAGLSDRLADFRIRMQEWWEVVRAGDISNDNLPFVTLVQALIFLATYFAAWCLYRWQNAWLAVIPSGVILLTNISFLSGQPSGAFVVFLFGAIVLAGRLHLQKNQTLWKREGIEYPDFISVSAIQLTVTLAAGLVIAAWWLPLGDQANAAERVFDAIARPVTNQSDSLVRLFHNIDSRKGASLHSFGNTLPIQGPVSLGTKGLFEIQSPDAGLIRATSYDVYTGNGWKQGKRDTERVDASATGVDEQEATYESRDVSILRVKLLDAQSTLLTPGSPIAANIDTTIETPKGYDGDIEEMRSRRGLNKGDTYNTIGTRSRASLTQLLEAGSDYPGWVTGRYLQLPDTLPGRVAEEAERVIREANATTPYEAAKALEAYLRAFPYDLDVQSPPPGRDAVDFFLFELKRGYFDYQSTALVVMLRSQGIPARLAVGYVLDPGSGDETAYTVRKDNAYSWVEVFFPRLGWIDFNPTADRPEGGVGGLGSIDFIPPDEPFISPNLDDFFGEDISPEDIPGLVSDALAEPPVVNEPFNWMIVWVPAGVLAVIAAGGLGARLAWNWGMGGLDGRARMWAKTQRLAGWAGLGSRQAETPREWSRRMGRAIEREAEAVTLSAAFEEARYGRPDLQRIDDEQATTSYRGLRGALFAKLMRRRQRPPRAKKQA
ncbi:MAG TPA: transglutaminase domain-containing protein [Tepidiformaceae bacterium]|nr:transglutaminase domain-containing protein [Tepidiformaceae bacterium]